MIQANFSITRNLANFIVARHMKQNLVDKHIVTRIAGLMLSIFSLIDTTAHSMAMIESGLRGIFYKQRNFTDFYRHAKCARIFFSLFAGSFFLGGISPLTLLKGIEDENVACINTLLLSKYPQYSENCVIRADRIVKYIKGYVAKMDAGDLLGMEDLSKLLTDAETFLHRQNLQELKRALQSKCTQKLVFYIKKNLSKQHLARLLSLALSITCALDIIFDTVVCSFVLFSHCTAKLLINKSILSISKREVLRYLAITLRDQCMHLAGMLAGSAIGAIRPKTAIQLIDEDSSWYKRFQCKGERYTEALLEDLASLPLGKTLLIPLSFCEKDNKHIVYCVAEKAAAGYHFSTLNTGYGMNYAETKLKALTAIRSGIASEKAWQIAFETRTDSRVKHLANYTFRNLSYSQLSVHVHALHQLAERSFSEIRQLADVYMVSPAYYTLEILYPTYIAVNGKSTSPECGKLHYGLPLLSLNPHLMFAFPQRIGDCPKSSLLTALNYHSAQRSAPPNHKPYDYWIRKLQELVFKQEGYLIDLSLDLKNEDRSAIKKAEEYVMIKWSSYFKKYRI